MTVPEVAEVLGTCDQTVRRYVHRGILPAIQIGSRGRMLFHPEDVQALLEPKTRRVNTPMLTNN